MRKTTKCLLCGAVAELSDEKYPGYQEPDTFDIYHCPTCYTSFSLPRVDTENIYNLIYHKGMEMPGYDRYWHYKNVVKTHTDALQFLYEAEESYWAPITVLKKVITGKHSAKILELGCGMGYLTYSLIQAGYDSIGLDISREAIEEAKHSFGDHYICADAYKFADLHKNEYDVIIMTELIEHVEAPADFLRHVTQMVKVGGIIIVTTPNKTVYPDTVIWKTDFPPVHCWWLSENSMKHIAREINCEVDFVDFSDYYRNNKTHICVDLSKQHLVTSILRENGEIIAPPLHIKWYRYKIWSRLIAIYKKIKSFVLPGAVFYYSCKERGPITCAVFKKSS